MVKPLDKHHHGAGTNNSNIAAIPNSHIVSSIDNTMDGCSSMFNSAPSSVTGNLRGNCLRC